MDQQLLNEGLEFSQKRKLAVLLAAFGFTSYGVYRVCQSPALVDKRNKLCNLLGALASIVEASSDSAETVGLVSRDLKQFLESDSDQIPKSLKQLSKIISSKEFSESMTNATQAMTVGFLNGYGSSSTEMSDVSSFLDRVFDKLLTPAGSGFASAVVGSFAKNMVMALFSDGQDLKNFASVGDNASEGIFTPGLVNVICSGKCKELIGDCVQMFISTAVAVYLEKTKDINTYDEILSGLTNPKHGKEAREMLLSVCNGAVETLVRSSYQVLTTSNSGSSYLGKFQGHGSFGGEALSAEWKRDILYDEIESCGWLRKVLSTLAVPSYRKSIITMTLTITLETFQAFLELLLEKLYDRLKKSITAVRETLVDSGVQVVRYVSAKCSVLTVCISFCLHIIDGVWVLVPA